MRRSVRGFVVVFVVAGLSVSGLAGSAQADGWPTRLAKGAKGENVRRLQTRVAGWYPSHDRVRFHIDGSYGEQTATAVERFEQHYGIRNPNGVATRPTFRILKRLGDDDGSTEHFSWSEFSQRSNSSCSAQANAYAGSFNGGRVSAKRTKRNVKRLMWRLEALRAKAGGQGVGINSGFRSVAYNSCIGGASASQHLYGTAADSKVVGITNDRARKIARGSQFYGISCYSNTTHNHLDLRLENSALPSAQVWYWPRIDSLGRELDDTGRPCWGETTQSAAAVASTDASGESASLVPTAEEVRAFEEAGEPADMQGSD